MEIVVCEGRIDMLKFLHKQCNFKFDQLNVKLNATPLMLAAVNSKLAAVQYLVE